MSLHKSLRFLFAAGVALWLAGPLAHAHDSWLGASRDTTPAGRHVLELSTGSRYPLQQFGQTAASVASSQCIDMSGQPLALRPLREQQTWLELAIAAADEDQEPLSCWLELHAADIEIEPRIVDLYFADIHAPVAIRQAWGALRARNIPWHETYRKFARIDLVPPGATAAGAITAARRPVHMDLEIVLLGDRPVAAGQPLEFQVLRDGQPLAGLPVELVSERSPLGVWRETDTQGMLRHTLPFGGRWLLRGTDLRVSERQPDTWESRFVTLAIEAR